MSNCGNCLFQGDRNTDQKGNSVIFCLVRCYWYPETSTCGQFREYADLNKEVRIKYASDIRQEEAEDKRLKSIMKSNLKLVLIVLGVSFALFWLTVKLFDKYIF
ncbi:MAG: hypothetical protein JW803_03455 [Endomicrobiales bacterium]|nr:hypothetical protein [Endomicrobiales bacterium]